MKPLSWKPIRKGALYCAPACGGGCTWSAHQEAQRKGKALARRLGPGWEFEVWENLGWHYAARAAGGLVRVREHDRQFTAYMLGGAWQGWTPRAAVMRGLREASQRLADARQIARALLGVSLLPPIARAQRLQLLGIDKSG